MPDPRDKKKQGIGPSIELKDDLSNVNEWLNYKNTINPPRSSSWTIPAELDYKENFPEIKAQRAQAKNTLSQGLDQPKPLTALEKFSDLFFKQPRGTDNVQGSYIDNSRESALRGMAALDALRDHPEAAKHIRTVDPDGNLSSRIGGMYNMGTGNMFLNKNINNYSEARDTMAHEMGHGMGLGDTEFPNGLDAYDMNSASNILNGMGNFYRVDRQLPYTPTKGIGPTGTTKKAKK